MPWPGNPHVPVPSPSPSGLCSLSRHSDHFLQLNGSTCLLSEEPSRDAPRVQRAVQDQGRLSVCSRSGGGGGLLGSHPHTGPGMQGEGDEREGAARRVGGAQLVSGEPSLSAIRVTLVTQVRVSCLVFTLAFAHTQRGWQVGQGGQRVGESGFQGENLPPRSGVMFWGQVTSVVGSPAPTQAPTRTSPLGTPGATSFLVFQMQVVLGSSPLIVKATYVCRARLRQHRRELPKSSLPVADRGRRGL